MRLTVLTDNNTITDQYFLGEPGISLFIEEVDQKILFDLGYSDIFISNASKMGIDVKNANSVIFSHGHLDHTWGLEHLIDYYKSAQHKKDNSGATIIAHPQVFCTKYFGDEQIGIRYEESELKKYFKIKLSQRPIWISERLVFLGQIPRCNDFENKEPIGTTVVNGKLQADFVLDDSALAYRSAKGLVIITGCSHSGICNIIEYAREICGNSRIAAVIGGMHLLEPSEEVMKHTLQYFEDIQPEAIYACHCTDLQSKIALSKVAEVKEVGVGLVLEYK